ncbi:MAG: hypothetical protein NZ524_00045 [Thiobacillaceae bacterium]|nr:hypothetical protein [Thiobacillaceae bacterium]
MSANGATHLVFIETSANQAYIYATNRLRENIGASELTWRAGCRWPLASAGLDPGGRSAEPQALRDWLRGAPRANGVEVVLAASGKALLLVDARSRAEAIVAEVSACAAREAPGLSVCGAIVELSDRTDPKACAKAMREVHERFETNRQAMAQVRFAWLPYTVACASSGLPACGQQAGEFLSAPSLAKRTAAPEWFTRIRAVMRERTRDLFITQSLDQLEAKFDDLTWVGLVFADGNGLGQIMLRFDQWLQPDEDYFDALRRFSVELDEACERAFVRACDHLAGLGAVQQLARGGRRLPLVPLILGGDDLTVAIDGRYALPFTDQYLRAFEEETGAQPTVSAIARRALGAARLSAAAGIAIVKPHFPFHSAHDLAEGLLRSAKTVKRKVVRNGQPYPASALDFHLLLDAAYTGLETIRAHRMGAGGERLWGGPYVVTPLEELQEVDDPTWARHHHLDRLRARVQALRARDEEGRRRLPNSQMHALREALALGRTLADARLREFAWLRGQGLETLLEAEGSLFYCEDGVTATQFVDALTSVDYWGLRDDVDSAQTDRKSCETVQR